MTYVLLAISISVTLLHVWREWADSSGPLHEYFSWKINRKIPREFAVWFFGILLVASHVAVAAAGYALNNEFLLWLLAGLRFGDVFFSHALLGFISDQEPWDNPGIWTTPLQIGDGLLAVAYLGYLKSQYIIDGDMHWLAFGGGIAAFAAVLPTLMVLGMVFGWEQEHQRVRELL